MTTFKPTLIGFSAILMWSFLALLTVASGDIPPFQLAAMTFSVGGMVGLVTMPFRPAALRNLRQPWYVWLFGSAGLCIYHVAYFFAIQAAPAVEVSLIAYLWPLLIVFFAALLPTERLRLHHILGVALGLLGAVTIISKGFSIGFSQGLLPGHIIAFAAAFIWAGYSVLSRRFGAVPTDVVLGYCLVTAVVSLGLHLGLETTRWPQTTGAWVALGLLGLIPLGVAFYAWDHGCKHGDIMVLGALSYAAPLFSVIILILAGFGAYHWSVAVACVLIVLGALVASNPFEGQRRGDNSEK
jgi:drug/metabolite transporter (DMT)-like permease